MIGRIATFDGVPGNRTPHLDLARIKCSPLRTPAIEETVAGFEPAREGFADPCLATLATPSGWMESESNRRRIALQAIALPAELSILCRCRDSNPDAVAPPSRDGVSAYFTTTALHATGGIRTHTVLRLKQTPPANWATVARCRDRDSNPDAVRAAV